MPATGNQLSCWQGGDSGQHPAREAEDHHADVFQPTSRRQSRLITSQEEVSSLIYHILKSSFIAASVDLQQ